MNLKNNKRINIKVIAFFIATLLCLSLVSVAESSENSLPLDDNIIMGLSSNTTENDHDALGLSEESALPGEDTVQTEEDPTEQIDTPSLGASDATTPLLLRAEANDITVSSPPANYFLSTYSLQPQQVEVPMQITVGKNVIQDSMIVVSHAPTDPALEDLNFILPLKVEWQPEVNPYIDHYEIFDREVHIFLSNTDKTNYSFAIKIEYTFNYAEHERKAPSKKDIGRITTVAYNNGVEVFHSLQRAVFKSNDRLSISKYNSILFPAGATSTPTSSQLTMTDDQELQLFSNVDISKRSQRFQLDRTREISFLLPVGIEITAPPFGDMSLDFTIDKGMNGKGVDIPDNYYHGSNGLVVPGGKYYKISATLPDTIPGNWPATSEYSYTTSTELHLKFPPVPSNVENIEYHIFQVVEAYGYYDSEPVTSAYDFHITVRDHTRGIWEFEPEVKFNVLDSPTVVFTNVSGQRFETTTGSSNFGSRGGYNNTGTKPVKNLRLNSYLKPENGDFSSTMLTSLMLYFGRESNTVSYPGGRYTYTVSDANTNQTTRHEMYITAEELNSSNQGTYVYKSINLPQPTEPGQYISSISFEPMAENMVDVELPPKTSISLRIITSSWPNNLYPNGLSAQDGDSFYHMLDVSYLNDEEQLQEITKSIRFTYEEDGVRPNTTLSIKNLTNSSGSSFHNPNDRLKLTLSVQNLPPIGAQLGNILWRDPVILLKVPEAVTLEFGQDFVFNDGYPRQAIGGLIEVKDGYKFYRLSIVQSIVLSSSYYTAEFGPFYYTVSADIPANTPYPLITQIATAKNLDEFTIYKDSRATLAQTKEFDLPEGKGGGYGKTNIYVSSWPHMESNSKIRSQSFPTWSSEQMVIAGNNEEVENKLIIDNKGNTIFSDLKLYNIIPRAGVNGSSDNMLLDFLGVEAEKGTVYYYHGDTIPPLEDINTIQYLGSGWDQNPQDAKAFMLVVTSQHLAPKESLSTNIRYKTPSSKSGTQTAVTQFSYSATTGNNQKLVFVSAKQAFKTDVYSVEYLPSPEDAEITNMPPNVSGSFTHETKYDVSVSDQIPVRKGYEFIGWNTMPDGSGTDHHAGDIITLNKDTTRHIYLYPQWFRKEFTVTFDPNGGELLTPNKIDVLVDSTFNAPEITPPYGYKLKGWYFDTHLWDFDTDTMPDHDLTLTAEWEVSGILALRSVPDLDFGSHPITLDNGYIHLASPVSIQVEDSRPAEMVNDWMVTVKAEQMVLVGGNTTEYKLPADTLRYSKDNVFYSLEFPSTILKGRGKATPGQEFHTITWDGDGLDEVVLSVPMDIAVTGTYRAVVTWSVEITP